jgi:hypothetical protein
LDQGDRETDIHDGRVCTFGATDATGHSDVPRGEALGSEKKLEA